MLDMDNFCIYSEESLYYIYIYIYSSEKVNKICFFGSSCKRAKQIDFW